MDLTSEHDPSSPIISLPHLKLLVLSNMDPNHVLRHLRVPRGAHLELSCDANLPFPNPNLENLSRLEYWRFTHRKIAGVKEKTLTGLGPSGSVRIKWVQHMPWVDFFSPFSLSCVRKLHLHNVDDIHSRSSDTLETMLGGMDHLETVILDGSNFKFFCSALARREPTPLCPSLHTFVYCETWDAFVCHFVESVAKCRHEEPRVPSLKRLIIATNIHLPTTEELHQLSFFVDSLELRMTTQVPETWEERSSEWGSAPRLVENVLEI